MPFPSFQSTRTHAQAIAAEIIRRFPPTLANDPARILSPKRLTTIIEEAAEHASAVSKHERFNWLQKAIFVNDFKWDLLDVGYNPAFVEVATEAVVVYITTRAPKATDTPSAENGACGPDSLS